jgi:hypothetical protein
MSTTAVRATSNRVCHVKSISLPKKSSSAKFSITTSCHSLLIAWLRLKDHGNAAQLRRLFSTGLDRTPSAIAADGPSGAFAAGSSALGR